MRSTLAILCLFVVSCADAPEDAAIEEAEASPTDAEIAAARQSALESVEAIELPEFAPAAPITAFCFDEYCAVNKVTFEKRDWPGAWSGDYEWQRNVAYCLQTGCDGAVMTDSTEACAWRAAIIELHPRDATELDADMLQHACGDLSPTRRELAIRKGEEIIAQLR